MKACGAMARVSRYESKVPVIMRVSMLARWYVAWLYNAKNDFKNALSQA